MLLFLSLILLSLIILYIYLKKHYRRSLNDLPGQEPNIFFGNLINSGLLIGKKTFHEVMIDYQQRYGDKFVFWFGSYQCPTFCLSQHAEQIFSSRHLFDQSPLFLPNFDLLCPHGIFLLQGQQWKRHIRVILPMLKKGKVVQHIDSIVQCTDQFIQDHFNENNQQIHRDLKIHSQSLLLNIIGLIAFNYDFHSQMNFKLKKALQYFLFQSSLIMIIPWIPRSLITIYLKYNWKYQQAHQLIRQLTETILQNEQNNSNDNSNPRSNNLIASLLSSVNENATNEQISSGLTRNEILDEILSLILAGYETTSTALSWFIFYMTKYPQIQNKIKQELHQHDLLLTEHLEDLPSLTQQQLDSLIYAECVTKEVLRLSPIAGVTTRMALEDTMIDNVPIRAGQTILIALHNINTDRRYWHHNDPKLFLPERFLNEDQHPHPYTMLSFGGGHRACPGQDLAHLELKTIIVRLMQRNLTFEDTMENLGGYEESLTCSPKHLVVRVHMHH